MKFFEKKVEENSMLKVVKGFSDLANGLRKYEVGDSYEEKYPTVTADLIKRGFIQKVESQKVEEKKYEAVQKEQK